jgi:hypothetical protein
MRYTTCPKCGHAPLPEDQALPAACPACGLVLAKYGAAPPVRVPTRHPAGNEEPGTLLERVEAWLLPLPDRVSKTTWQARAAALAVLALWTLWIWYDIDIRNGNAGSTFLHLILLPFHEAGHYAIFRWFGEFIMILGGTLGQHLMPIVMGGALLIQRRDAFGAAIFAWLLGFSVVDMAVYMYDAFDPRLMLLGGATGQESDGHDWQNLFGDTRMLHRARGIGLFFGALGMLMMAGALAWALGALRLQRKRVGDPLADDFEAG